jgi:choline dehydrogenase-like flavoprotein
VAWPVLDAVRRAAIDAGIPAVDDFNRGDNEGVGPLHVNQRRGLRFQAASAFLRPALIRPNLTLETGVVAERIRLKERRAVGVDYLADGTRQSAFARRDVILAAGAIGSPQLLMLSGIGPARTWPSTGRGPRTGPASGRPTTICRSRCATRSRGRDAQRALPLAAAQGADGRPVRPVPRGL